MLLSKEILYHGSISEIVTEVRHWQSLKASLPMLVTPLPIMTEVTPLQPKNALLPIEVTLFGIVMEVRPLQPENA